MIHPNTLTAFVILLCVAISSAQPARATVTTAGPVFIRPGAETALTTLATGTELKVLQEEAGWAEVEFTDPRWGYRVGWLETRFIRTALEGATPPGALRVEARVVADRPLPSSPVSRDATADAGAEPVKATAKLTDLFSDAKIKHPHIVVERIVKEIDELVLKVRFPDWQSTSEGERLVQEQLRKVLLKYQLLRDQQLYDRAFSCLVQFY